MNKVKQYVSHGLVLCILQKQAVECSDPQCLGMAAIKPLSPFKLEVFPCSRTLFYLIIC